MIPIATIFVVLGILLGFGAYILASVQTEIGAKAGVNSTAANATRDALLGVGTFGSWMPMLALVIVAGIIITTLLVFVLGRISGAGKGGHY